MSRRAALWVAGILVAALALWAWRSQLFVVSRPGDRPLPLAVRAERDRPAAVLDVVLPAVPVGMRHLRHDQGVLLIHYWAPWEQHGAVQAAMLDSLQRLDELARLDVAMVCFDPFPSVARFVARRHLRVNVLLDHERLLRRTLPCPSVPFTYVLDTGGRVAVAQAGEVEWLAKETILGLRRLLDEPAPAARPAPSPS